MQRLQTMTDSELVDELGRLRRRQRGFQARADRLVNLCARVLPVLRLLLWVAWVLLAALAMASATLALAKLGFQAPVEAVQLLALVTHLAMSAMLVPLLVALGFLGREAASRSAVKRDLALARLERDRRGRAARDRWAPLVEEPARAWRSRYQILPNRVPAPQGPLAPLELLRLEVFQGPVPATHRALWDQFLRDRLDVVRARMAEEQAQALRARDSGSPAPRT